MLLGIAAGALMRKERDRAVVRPSIVTWRVRDADGIRLGATTGRMTLFLSSNSLLRPWDKELSDSLV